MSEMDLNVEYAKEAAAAYWFALEVANAIRRWDEEKHGNPMTELEKENFESVRLLVGVALSVVSDGKKLEYENFVEFMEKLKDGDAVAKRAWSLMDGYLRMLYMLLAGDLTPDVFFDSLRNFVLKVSETYFENPSEEKMESIKTFVEKVNEFIKEVS